MSYWTDLPPFSAAQEKSMGPWKSTFEELGIAMEEKPLAITEAVQSATVDARNFHIGNWSAAGTPRRLDPSDGLTRYTVPNAGVAGGANYSQYTNCEYTHVANQSTAITDEDERRKTVHEAFKLISEDSGIITQTNIPIFGGYNKRIDFKGAGNMNMQSHMWHLRQSTVKDGDNVIVWASTPGSLQKINNPAPLSPAIRSYLIWSPLFEPSPEGEFQPCLAKDYEVSDDLTEVTVSLQDDVVFHNGDPITAEDVAWSFWFYFNNPSYYYWAADVPWNWEADPDYGFAEVVDDTTVRFHLKESYAPFMVTLSHWGILHKESSIAQGAEEKPQEFEPDDPFIGSGPFTVSDFKSSEIMRLEPHPHEHPVSNPSHRANLVAFGDPTAMYKALVSESVDIIPGVNYNFLSQMENEDHIESYVQEDVHGVLFAAPQQSHAPFKFKELRQAVSASLNRKEINTIAFGGKGTVETADTLFVGSNPWHPPDEAVVRHTEDPTGEPEVGRQILEDAGWGWDGDGNLHYPPDADLDPVWPDGEMPSPDDFPCIDEEGNYVPN
jgi:peptide/nickel transport system substrate-binding protein